MPPSWRMSSRATGFITKLGRLEFAKKHLRRIQTTRTFLVPLIGDIWSLMVGTWALIEGRRRV